MNVPQKEKAKKEIKRLLRFMVNYFIISSIQGITDLDIDILRIAISL
jgi:hypothetical protein